MCVFVCVCVCVCVCVYKVPGVPSPRQYPPLVLWYACVCMCVCVCVCCVCVCVCIKYQGFPLLLSTSLYGRTFLRASVPKTAGEGLIIKRTKDQGRASPLPKEVVFKSTNWVFK